MSPNIEDARLLSPQCAALVPVETVHENPWFSVRNRGGYYTIEYNRPQAVVLPIVENRAIVMVRVKRPVIADVTWELPAGGAKGRETPIEAVARELLEETGIEIRDLRRFEKLSPLSVSPRHPYLAHIFQIHITRTEYDRRKRHDDEIESVECFMFDDILRKIVDGEIYMSLPIAILTRFFLENNGKL